MADLGHRRLLRGLPAFELLGHDAEVAPLHLFALISRILADAVDLQSDKAGGCHFVDDIGGQLTIDPDPDTAADGFDTIEIPFTGFESRFAGRVAFEIVEPATACFIINAAAPGARGGFNLDLIAMHPSILIFGYAEAANLDARVEAIIDHGFKFKDEIVIHLLCRKKRVRNVDPADASDNPLLVEELGLAVEQFEIFEILAVT